MMVNPEGRRIQTISLKTPADLEHWLAEAQAGRCYILSISCYRGRGVFTEMVVQLREGTR